MLILLLACGGDDSGVLKPTWWPDGDGDGFGDPAAAVAQEVAPGGYVDNAEDCDDTNPAHTAWAFVYEIGSWSR